MATGGQSFREELHVPPDLKAAYLQRAVSSNRNAVLALAIFGALAETVNIIRALFFSASGLHSVNNRIYFGFYSFMLVFAVLVLCLHLFCKRRIRQLYYLQVIAVGIALFWNTSLSAYDAISAQSGKALVLVTFLLCYAALFLLKPAVAISNIIANVLLYWLLTYPYQSPGVCVNIVIAAGIACIVAVSKFRHVYIELEQQKKLRDFDSELQSEREKFRLSQDQYTLLINQTDDILFRWDIANDTMLFSHNWQLLFGYPRQIAGFTKWLDTHTDIDKELKHILRRALERIEQGGGAQEFGILVHGMRGVEKWFQARVLTQFSADGHPMFGIGLLHDVTEHKQTIAELEYAVQKDPPTGVLNKAAIETHVQKRLHAVNTGMFALLVVDMDNFKSINDTYGHPCGDYVLMECVKNMQAVFDGAVFGRIGGDEFIIFAEHVSEPVLLNQVERYLQRVSQILWKGKPLGASCSVGISFSAAGAEYARLYYEADDAMYTAKQKGKSGYHVYAADANRRQRVKNQYLAKPAKVGDAKQKG